MKHMKHIGKNSIPVELYNIPVFIYGGGYTGKVIANLLISKGIKIENIVDDNEGIQGTHVEGIGVISYKELCEISKEYEHVAVILTTIYGKAVLKKVSSIHNIQVYEIYDWYNKLIGKNDDIRKFVQDTEKVQEMKIQIADLSDKWADEKSGNVLAGLIHYLDTKDLNDIAIVCTDEEQYFISEVKAAIDYPLSIIDAGAYRGELFQSFKNNALDIDKWYCFEADLENYSMLLEQSERNGLDEKQVCVNKGLWSKSEKLFFEGGGSASRIVSYKTDNVIDVVSIDEYMGERKCNYIKMDIEGAEFPALMGGINLIKRERPILAISIYHSLDDFWKIPQYLMSELENYRYYVRHHSLIFCETVLYGIPNEL